MKVTDLTNKEFNPIEFSVKIESKRELEFWWALTNGSYENLKDSINENIRDMDIEPFSANEKALMSFPDRAFPLIDGFLDPKSK